MSKKKFNRAERYAVFKSLGPNCRWCNEPVEYPDCQIDHIIPEYLLDNDPLRLIVLQKYGLPETFEINSFENWIPTHPSCNQSKHKKVVKGAPVFLELLEEVKRKVPETKKLFKNWSNAPKATRLIAMIERGLDTGIIEKKTITGVVAGINDTVEPITGLTGSTIDNQVFYVPTSEVWITTKRDEDFYYMKKDDDMGIVPIDPSKHPDMVCPHCWNYGPWDGNLCLNCRKTSYE